MDRHINIDSVQGITVLGSTGSIGVNTLDVISRQKDRFRVIALTANQQVERLFEQCLQHHPEYAVMVDSDAASVLETKLQNEGLSTQVLSGTQALVKVSQLDSVQVVMAAIVGAAGLKPSLAAAEKGKSILLANKEALVMSGPIFMDTVVKNKARLLPIDSEHNAVFQCLPAGYEQGLDAVGVKKIILTASGGPFINKPIEELQAVTPDEACHHPNWDMGRKISVDSATMMNKGLEVIEACWLFRTTVEKIEIVVHPQSVVHSMVEYVDGSVLAQLGNPDMRTPIAHALAWPYRFSSGTQSLNLLDIAKLEFIKPDYEKFPCIQLAYQAMKAGGTSSAILNAANEVAVDNFLQGKLAFMKIARVIEKTLERATMHDADHLDIILEDDNAARNIANDIILQGL